jgi:hypothetical protein
VDGRDVSSDVVRGDLSDVVRDDLRNDNPIPDNITTQKVPHYIPTGERW